MLCADLAFDGSLPENWKGKKTVFVDKLYYPGQPQDNGYTGSSESLPPVVMYNKDSS